STPPRAASSRRRCAPRASLIASRSIRRSESPTWRATAASACWAPTSGARQCWSSCVPGNPCPCPCPRLAREARGARAGLFPGRAQELAAQRLAGGFQLREDGAEDRRRRAATQHRGGLTGPQVHEVAAAGLASGGAELGR